MHLLWLDRVGFLWIFAHMPVSSQSVGSQSSYNRFDYSHGHCEGNTSLIGDGVCDPSVNTVACDFDGGDCCECSCFVVGIPCNRTGAAFDCYDPDDFTDCSPMAPNVDPTSILAYSGCAGHVPDIKDGYCNDANNNADCGYDGGDCCSCTCVDDLEYLCGEQEGGFDCRDPDVILGCLFNGTSCEGDLAYIRDFDCDNSLNNSECNYDGGDCCLCTCGDGNSSLSSLYSGDESPQHMCGGGGFDCLDPSAPTDCAGCLGPGEYIGDGVCDEVTNSLECECDGGDCCRCTCVETEDYFCPESRFDCLDPDAPTDCETESSLESDSSGCQDLQSTVSDGQCNEETNTAVCGWDGGDCCECTCTDNMFSCGVAGYSCLDPSQDCGPSVNNTTTTNASLSRDEVVGMLSAFFVGYCFLGGVIVVVLVCIRRRCSSGVASPTRSATGTATV